MAKPCKWCGSDMHTSIMCFQRPRTAIKSKRQVINRLGPVAAKWIETRHDWIHQNATPDGTWQCYYGAERLGVVADPDNGIELLTLDHKLSRARHPELRFELSNLVPSCATHNSEKGSKSAEEYIEWLEQSLGEQKLPEPTNVNMAGTSTGQSVQKAAGMVEQEDSTT